MEKSMTIFDELTARGLLAQFTDEEEIKELQQRIRASRLTKEFLMRNKV